MGTKIHQKDGRLPIFFFFQTPIVFFFISGAYCSPNAHLFFYDAHVLHKILMGEFWLDGAVQGCGVGAGGQPTVGYFII